jgi:hypothetical protein
MKGSCKALLLALAVVLTGASCDGCDLVQVNPTGADLDFFSVVHGNPGSTSYVFQLQKSTTFVSLAPGAQQREESFQGVDGDTFTFVFSFTTPGASNATTVKGTCTLNNAEVALVFTREVDFNPDTGLVHCINWGG